MKGIKQAAAECGIEYNVGTHSQRKTYGATSIMLHPNDPNRMAIVSSDFNHSSEAMTRRYVGIEKKDQDQYRDDMGEFFDTYVVGGEEYKDVGKKPIVSMDANDLRALISMAYEAGMKNASAENPMVHVDAMNELLSVAEGVTR